MNTTDKIAQTMRDIDQPNIDRCFVVCAGSSELSMKNSILGMEIHVTSASFLTAHGHDFMIVDGEESTLSQKFDREYLN